MAFLTSAFKFRGFKPYPASSDNLNEQIFRTQRMRIISKGKIKKTKEIITAIKIVNIVSGILDEHFIRNIKGTFRLY